MKSLWKVFALSIVTILSLSGATGANNDRPTDTKSFTVKKGGTLRVTLRGGDVRLTPWEKDEVYVSVRGGDDDEGDVTIKQRENTIIIQSDNEEDWNGDTRLDISLPSQFDLDIHTAQGSIIIDGPISGKVSGTTSAGDIRVGDISGTVDLTTSGGDLRAGDIKGDLNLRTSGGDIVAGSVIGDADISTAGGNIRLKNVSKTLWAKTAGGDVEVGDIGGDVTISTAGGNIVVGKVTTGANLLTAGGDIELESAKGHVKAKTAGGNLHLYSLNGFVDGETSGGDVEVELTPDGTNPSRLRTAGGNVFLYLPENAKATVDARIRIQGGWRHAKDEYRIRSAYKSDTYVVDDNEREIHGSYILNGGGASISLETVNADIEIGKLGSHSRKPADE